MNEIQKAAVDQANQLLCAAGLPGYQQVWRKANEQFEQHMVIDVKVASVYGQPRIYPANERAIALADLLGVKSFNQHQLAKARALGFSVNVVQDNALVSKALGSVLA